MAVASVYLLLFIVVCVAATTVFGSDGVGLEVTHEEVLQIINDTNVLLVDVRRADECAETGLIPSAINIPVADFEGVMNEITNDEFLEQYQRQKPNFDSQIVVYCLSGTRAQAALNIALELGYKNTRRYAGSWLEWSEKQSENAASSARPDRHLLLAVGVVLTGMLGEAIAIK